ncbi:hypothetical protein SAMN06265368_1778 [Cohaesibacter gelatinilyticus]|uniref:Uncharacterized protein n=1 Tax=Cohaesibacter gelatinilyticus TaxID=372072 RepID=A0A285NHG3_9HYPH|nr:hypothetical protein SAMN06265368_1778 [Cohaesibacter gelatinilyticus]
MGASYLFFLLLLKGPAGLQVEVLPDFCPWMLCCVTGRLKTDKAIGNDWTFKED